MYIYGATVTVTDTNIYSNTAAYEVSACLLEPSWHFLRTPPAEETSLN